MAGLKALELNKKVTANKKKILLALSAILAFGLLSTLYTLRTPAFASGPLPTLQGYWKFDEESGSTAIDSSSNGNDGTITNPHYNNEHYAPTNFENKSSLSFDGNIEEESAGSNVTIPDDDSLDITGDMTAQMWVYWHGEKTDPIPFNDDHTLFHKGNNYHFIIKQDGRIESLTGSTLDSEENLPTHEWALITFTIEDGIIKIYLNNNLVGEGEATVGPTNSDPLYIGRDQLTRFFNGSIDEVRIYNYALSSDDIEEIANGNEGPGETFAGGDGTNESPYVIKNCEQLQNINDEDEYLSASYILTEDIDCSKTNPNIDDFNENGTWSDRKGFNPIGSNTRPFTGVFDGNGHAISNLFIERADDNSEVSEDDEPFVGLFGYLLNAEIKAVSLEDAYIKGYEYVGGIAGLSEFSRIADATVNKDVAGNDCSPGYCIWARWGTYGGGIVGATSDTELENVHTGGPVKGSGTVIGGIAGMLSDDSTIINSSSESDIDGGNSIGGLVGLIVNSTIENSHASGDVEVVYEDSDKTGNGGGGLVGFAESSTISDSYATGFVYGYDTIGGLVGSATNETTITQSYATNSVEGESYIGGLVGYIEDAVITSSFATGDIFGYGTNVGGFGGEIRAGQVSDSYATGDVTAYVYAGGLIGTIYGGEVTRNYATGIVEVVDGRAGAFSGEAFEDSSDIILTDSFATGLVIAPEDEGGFIANLDLDGMEFSNNLFDITRTGLQSCTGTGDDVEGCTGVNQENSDSDYFYNSSSNNPFDQWDFAEVWKTREYTYPCLLWETDETCAKITPNITTCEELQGIKNDLSLDYVLKNDLDCAFTPEDTVYSEDFEDGRDDWVTGGEDDTWHLDTETCNFYGEESNIKLDSQMMGSNGNAGPDCDNNHNENSYLISPEISLPNAEKLNLEFDSLAADEAGSCEEDYDSKAVAITTDGGNSFTVLNDCHSLNASVHYKLDNRKWRFDISEFAGEDIQIMFKYNTEDGCCEEDLGWFVDNISVYEGGTLFSPIGSANKMFTGTFDGQGHTISNLEIIASQDGVGLFGGIEEGATVSNLVLKNATISNPDNYTGTIAGMNYGEVTNVTVTDSKVFGSLDAGGLVGENNYIIESSSMTGEVSGYDEVGGLIGENEDYGSVEYSSSSASVESSGDTGGLVGNNDGLISVSYADGDVTAYIDDAAGGLVGTNDGAIIDTYSWSTVDGDDRTGGLIGINQGHGTIQNSYSTGWVMGDDEVGGLIGYFSGGEVTDSFTASDVITSNEDGELAGGMFGIRELEPGEAIVENSYYDMERSLTYCEDGGQTADPEGCTGVNGENTNPNYFFNNHTNPPLDQWDFANTWIANETYYPTFRAVVSTDSDDDGISDAIENAGPNNGDANGDGTPDSQQGHVASLVNPITGKYSVLEVFEECSINSVGITAESDISQVKDSGYDYPAGLMNFSIACGIEGITVAITQFHYGVTGDLTLRKYNHRIGGYFQIEGARITDDSIGGQSVKLAEYRVTDGGIYDIDNDANGTIEDPAGLAQLVVGVPNTGLGGVRY